MIFCIIRDTSALLQIAVTPVSRRLWFPSVVLTRSTLGQANTPDLDRAATSRSSICITTIQL